MLARLALLFIVVPLVELLLLIEMGRWVGLLPTLSLVVLTGLIGAWLARLEGTRTLMSYRAQVAHGSMPGQAVMDGLCILIGGALLLTPGLLTDVVGFLAPPAAEPPVDSTAHPTAPREEAHRRVRPLLDVPLRRGLGGLHWFRASARSGL